MSRRSVQLIVVLLATSSVALVACVSDDTQGSTPVAPSCEDYCNLVRAKCTGDNIQYRTDAECLRTCSFLELGSDLDTSGNTVGCRMNKARNATTPEACVAAGAFGGGECGTRCGSFCTFVGKNCLGLENPIFDGSEGTCNEECPGFAPLRPGEREGPLSEFNGLNSLACRSHHLILSLQSENDAKQHCPHAGIDSSTCKR